MKEIQKIKPSKLNGETSTLAKGVHGFDKTITIFRGATNRTSLRTVSVKTVKNKKSKKKEKTIYQRGKDAMSKLFGHRTTITFLSEMSPKDRAKAVKNWDRNKKSTTFRYTALDDMSKKDRIKVVRNWK